MILACGYANFQEEYADYPWQSTTISTYTAGKLYQEHEEVLRGVLNQLNDSDSSMDIDGRTIWCSGLPEYQP